MTNSTSTQTSINDVLSFIVSSATAEDMDRIMTAMKSRHAIIADQLSMTIQVGDTVTTHNLSPKAISGLTGKVVAVKGKRVDIEVSDTRQLQRVAYGQRSRFTFAANDAINKGTPLLIEGVPVSAVSA